MTAEHAIVSPHTIVAQAPSGRWAVLVRYLPASVWVQVATRPREAFLAARQEAAEFERDAVLRERAWKDHCGFTSANWGNDRFDPDLPGFGTLSAKRPWAGWLGDLIDWTP